jgi:hypothetical protein
MLTVRKLVKDVQTAVEAALSLWGAAGADWT